MNTVFKSIIWILTFAIPALFTLKLGVGEMIEKKDFLSFLHLIFVTIILIVYGITVRKWMEKYKVEKTN